MYRLPYRNESTIIPNRQYRLLKRLNAPSGDTNPLSVVSTVFLAV